MGVDVHLMLLDRRAWARLAEVHRSWAEGRDAGPALALLREAAERVRKLAPYPTTRSQRMDEIGRRIDALPPAPEDEADGERLDRTMQALAGQALEAQERGDPAGAAKAAEQMAHSFFGTVLAPLQRADGRGALLREMFAIHEDPPGPGIELLAALEPAIAALSGAASPGREDDGIPWSTLFEAWAVAWDREPRADVLVDLLLPFERSPTLEELVGHARGEKLTLGEPFAELFSSEQVAAFERELRDIPDPAPKAPERVARVRRLVALAAADPRLALACLVA
jgi:hypothetical protein